MKIPTRVEFGIIAITDIAVNSKSGQAVTTLSISKRQNISLKYLEQILPSLKFASLIKSQKGSNGGYLINKEYEKITLRDIIDAIDTGILSDVSFDTLGENTVMAQTVNEILWNNMTAYMRKFSESITLNDLCSEYETRAASEHQQYMYYN